MKNCRCHLTHRYQITQQRRPLATGGSLTFPVLNKTSTRILYDKTVGIVQLQLEQDSGKSLHDLADARSFIDLNR